MRAPDPRRDSVGSCALVAGRVRSSGGSRASPEGEAGACARAVSATNPPDPPTARGEERRDWLYCERPRGMPISSLPAAMHPLKPIADRADNQEAHLCDTHPVR